MGGARGGGSCQRPQRSRILRMTSPCPTSMSKIRLWREGDDLHTHTPNTSQHQPAHTSSDRSSNRSQGSCPDSSSCGTVSTEGERSTRHHSTWPLAGPESRSSCSLLPSFHPNAPEFSVTGRCENTIPHHPSPLSHQDTSLRPIPNLHRGLGVTCHSTTAHATELTWLHCCRHHDCQLAAGPCVYI